MTAIISKPAQNRLDSSASARPKWAKIRKPRRKHTRGTLRIDVLVADAAVRVENAQQNGKIRGNTKLLGKYRLTLVRLALALMGIALAMASWSEFVFFNEEPSEKLIAALAQGPLTAAGFVLDIGLFYVIPSTLLVGLVGLYGSLSLGRILLIGALTGYAIEGAVVPAVYADFPISLVFTSLSWHAPITVGLGVFILPRLLADPSALKVTLVSAILGVAWAVWTTWVWDIEEVAPVTFDVFLTFAIASMATIVVGYLLLWAARWPDLNLPRWACIALMLPCIGFFLLQALNGPIVGAILFVILVGLFVILRWEGRATEDSYQIRGINLAAFLLMLVVALAVYALLLQTGAPIGHQDLVVSVVFLGFLAWVIGVARGMLHCHRDRQQP